MVYYAIAASGGGTDFQAAVDAQNAGQIPYGKIVALISNKADAKVLERARAANIPGYFIDHTVSQEETDRAIVKILKDTGAQFLFLAGYLKKITPAILAEVPVYNIHPALDPIRFGGKGMYGKHVHEAVILAGEKFAGATIHEVVEQYDEGKILMQTLPVPVLKEDSAETLQQRVLAEEHKLIPLFLDKLTREMEKKKMKLVIIGGGGREHAIANQFHKDYPQAKIIAIPGNAGIATQIPNAECIPIAATEVEKITQCICSMPQKPELVMVASDDPLALGLVDMLSAKGIRAFGGLQKATEIEWSKSFSKGFMKRHGIPTADYQVFDNMEKALAYVQAAPHPLVIKANGLALGKGVVISQNEKESQETVRLMMQDKKFGTAGASVVIEEFLTGPEVTLLAFVDGKNYALMPTSQDHKRAYDHDQGPNTGGMGAFSPAAAWSEELEKEVVKTIVKPTINGLISENRIFKGIIYFGLMVTPNGVKVIEYNARFGDPECQTVLPLLETDFLSVLNACIDGTLDKLEIQWKKQAAVCVVVASGGYPDNVKKGLPITIGKLSPAVKLIHAGTKQTPEGLVTNGGRVFCVTTAADTMQQARKIVYNEIDKIQFEGARYRKDIGNK